MSRSPSTAGVAGAPTGCGRVRYERHDNCFTQVEDFPRAQALLNAQLQVAWPTPRRDHRPRCFPAPGVVRRLLPGLLLEHLPERMGHRPVVHDPTSLRRLYPLLVRHAMTTLGVRRAAFPGRKWSHGPKVHGNFGGEVTSEVKERAEDADQAPRECQLVKPTTKPTRHARVLRPRQRSTSGGPAVFRPKSGAEDDWPGGDCQGVADLHRRAQVSQAANERYLEALSSVTTLATLEERVRPVTLPVTWKGKRCGPATVCPRRHGAAAAVSRGEFALQGCATGPALGALRDERRCPRRSAPPRRRVTRNSACCGARLSGKVRTPIRYQSPPKASHDHRHSTARQTPISQLAKAASNLRGTTRIEG